MIFLFLSGYLMLAKTFTDDLSWDIQRALVNTYFSVKKVIQILKDRIMDLLEENRYYKDRYIHVIERKPVKPVTAREHETIVGLKLRGLTTAEIKEKTGWSKSTITKRVNIGRADGVIPPMSVSFVSVL